MFYIQFDCFGFRFCLARRFNSSARIKLFIHTPQNKNHCARWLVPKIGTHPESSKQKEQNHHTDDPSNHQSAKTSPQPTTTHPENERIHADRQSTH
jgi:hypothetical protein